MQTTAPTRVIFWVTVVLAVLGLIGFFVAIPVLTGISFWLVVIAYVILATSVVTRGL